MNVTIEPPLTEAALTRRCQSIAGKTLAQIALLCNWQLPSSTTQGKGWAGQLIETVLGASARNQASPDFVELAIELKTLPLNQKGFPAESTYVTNIPLLTIHQQTWETSACWQKLKRVLWLPIEGDSRIPIAQRRVGMGFLWSPTNEQSTLLRQDWEEHVERIICGELEDINAKAGKYLQIRPKAANARTLTEAFDKQGNLTQTLPRGFYLRPSFTKQILG
ncbi:DNA mismatch repair endonuclease MutH [Legionella sp. W05-934-2]|jgi:DNA mismatch repair protein MutH|uniref:DNA mismatch repair endonuclease MutH n=1 Tax=Legionella sp. W05-934-2 TaxID=1198649 RepID=UPI0034621325